MSVARVAEVEEGEGNIIVNSRAWTLIEEIGGCG
jgi:hypothetical protein